MKIKTFFKNIWIKIKSITDKYLPLSVKVVQGVKKAIESEAYDTVLGIVKTMIKGEADDVILDKVTAFLRKRVPELCIQLEILNAANGSDDIESALKALKTTYGDKWEQFMSGLAGDLYNYLSDGKLDAKEAAALAKSFYDSYIKK